MQQVVATAVLLSSLATTAQAYTWQFDSEPKQCQNVSVTVSGGQPPYRILVLPEGPTALPDNKEIRRIAEIPFSGNENKVSFNLRWPANSQFVAVLSDASGFGSGGTTVATRIADSDDASCFDPNASVQPPFFFAITPENSLVQCQPSRLWWDPATVQGDVKFQGVIPGGNSFEIIPQGPITEVPSQGRGFSWTPSVSGGTLFHLVCGDNRGNGTAGSYRTTINSGTSGNNGGCINPDSPRSTPGTPAGAVATQTGGSGGGGSPSNPDSDSKSTPVGAIVGGVVGGLVAIISLFLIFWFFCRKRDLKTQKERPVDLLHSDEGDESNHAARLPEYYEPEPFVVPDPTSTDGRSDHRSSQAFSNGRSDTPDLLSIHGGTSAPSTTSGYQNRKKGGAPRPLRPVNIVQHDDAGPSSGPQPEGEPETIELPPAYTNLKPSASNPNLAGTARPSGSSTTAAGGSSSAAGYS